jgi:hypothetical protein
LCGCPLPLSLESPKTHNPPHALVAPKSDEDSSRFTHRLTRPVDIASLAFFRILFGLLMTAAIVRFMAKGWVHQLYLASSFHFPYPGFEWIRPFPDALMHAHFALLALLAFGVALGFYYRVCITLFFLGFTYVELLDQTAYLNHYYLISLVSGLLIFLPAHRAWSLDVWRKTSGGVERGCPSRSTSKPGGWLETFKRWQGVVATPKAFGAALQPAGEFRLDTVPAWCLNLLRFQVAVVYIFAGLAKFNADWLFHAQPLRIWFAARSDLPLLGPWLGQVWVAYAASWFGAIFDTSIVFFLLNRRTRRPAYACVIFFHVATWLLFNIGMFPWIMIVAATVFFPPDWPRHWIVKRRASSVERRAVDHAPRTTHHAPRSYALTLFLLAAYVLIQLALPLRSFFVAQPSAWTCSGFNCAWRVMLAEKTGYTEFYAHDPATGRRWRLPLKDYVTPRQEMLMAQDPYLIRALARRLAADLQKENCHPIEVKAEAFATLNGRPSQRLIDPEVDLAGPTPPRWIIPLKPEAANAQMTRL